MYMMIQAVNVERLSLPYSVLTPGRLVINSNLGDSQAGSRSQAAPYPYRVRVWVVSGRHALSGMAFGSVWRCELSRAVVTSH